MKNVILYFLLLFSTIIFAQEPVAVLPKQKSDFWQHVHFGAGIGLNVGGGFTNISFAPNAIYDVNKTVSLGAGIQGSFVSSKDQYHSTIIGGSLISLFNPIEAVQLSVELEEMNVNTTSNVALVGSNIFPKYSFWDTGLFLGAGYRMQNVTIGARYNVLFDKNKSVYSNAFMPFVRAYF
jgi:hypothetical protein